MIRKETIDRIVDAAQIEEVVGDFVTLKKRGANLLGNCPFHNEKTPSFTVSPVKGIYKCFGCGKAGNSVNFIMEHEKLSYPEALRFLAHKYNIEIEEDQTITEENKERYDRVESLMVVSNFAKKFFAENLLQSDEGRTIGLSYFKERGFREETIQKFELGYSSDAWDLLTSKAIAEGYKEELLIDTGLSIRNEERNSVYDRFRGRVMFPIHNISGRVIAFGGRILKPDPKSAKYVNSPESEIYHKSNVLYGIYFAKKAIREKDNCFLVEGYTDVISLHQSGIENVVASSGTSLTTEQIRLISRFTKNITILFDGDAAGIKASLRGIDMILEEGLNVKIVLFPDGQDPDSYVREVGGTAFVNYIEANRKDFILFKTTLLLSETKNDPIRKAELIHDIVESISKIPDPIKASLFVKECSVLMDMEERVLLSELNKLQLKKLKKENKLEEVQLEDSLLDHTLPKPYKVIETDETQEREIIRLLINYGTVTGWHKEEAQLTLAQYIIDHLRADDLEIHHALYHQVMAVFYTEYDLGRIPDSKFFINHAEQAISELSASLLSNPYSLSDRWVEHDIFIPTEDQILKRAADSALLHLKIKRVMKLIDVNREEMKEAQTEEEQTKRQEIHLQLTQVKIQLSKELGAVVLK